MIRRPSGWHSSLENMLWRFKLNRKLDWLYREVERKPILGGRSRTSRATPWGVPRPTWSNRNVIRLPNARSPRRKGNLLRRVPFWAIPAALVIGMPAVALVWDGLGRPIPALGRSMVESDVRITLGGTSASETFDGRSAVVVDGDTIAVGRERIRILNIDAPESHEPRCDRELVAGLKAEERLAQLVRVEAVSVARDGKDRYGRTLATLSAGGRDIGTVLIAEGLALPWQDGPQARAARIRHWCGS